MEYDKIFKGLSDGNRIAILKILKGKEICACDLSEQLKIPASTLAYHMKILQEARLVFGRKSGKWMYYSINEAQFKQAAKIIAEFIK